MVSNDTYITTVSAQELQVLMMSDVTCSSLAFVFPSHARTSCRQPSRVRALHFSFCLSALSSGTHYPTGNLCARDAKRQTKMSFGGRGRGFGGRSPGRGGRFGGRGGRGGRGRGEEGPPDEVVGAFCVLEELGPHLICSQLNCLFAVLPETLSYFYSLLRVMLCFFICLAS